MSDARSLLRAHRAQNRISHPHAAYTDAGKLLCKLCHEPVRADGLWDTHLRSQSHRQRLALLQGRPTMDSNNNNNSNSSMHKRKHSDVDQDEDMLSAGDEAVAAEEAIPKKRSRNDMISATTSTSTSAPAPLNRSDTATPPTLTRKSSHGTPVHGVEIQIPSRPATPGSSSTSTPHQHITLGRSPLGAASSGDAMSISTPTPTSTPGAAGATISTERLAVPQTTAPLAPPAAPTGVVGAVDEAEWAAFEAEVAAADAPAPAPVSANGFAADATISAPAMTAEQIAAKSQEEENQRRKQLLEAQIADEKEDAARALEAEFDEMAELEDRVRKLKERREQLRKAALGSKGRAAGKENAQVAGSTMIDDDEDDDEEDDGWDDGFRFRA